MKKRFINERKTIDIVGDFMQIPRRYFTHNEFKEEIIAHYRKYLRRMKDGATRRRKLKIYCLLSDGEIWKQIFNSYGTSENYGEIMRYNFKYSDVSGKRDRIATYYVYFDKDNSTVVLYTAENKNVIERTLNSYIRKNRGLYYLWLLPKSFNTIRNHMLEKYPDANITFFSAKRLPFEIVDCEIRPEYERAITYWGNDGRESLKEIEYYYGVFPRIIEFYIEREDMEKMRFRVSNESVFTLETSSRESIDLFFDLVEKAIPKILELKNLMESLKFEYKSRSTPEGMIDTPSAEVAQIIFSRKINERDINSLIEGLGVERLSIVNSILEKGSLMFSGTVIDDDKQTIFGISADEYGITLVPKYKETFDSFMKFFRFIIENIDSNAEIKKFNEVYE